MYGRQNTFLWHHLSTYIGTWCGILQRCNSPCIFAFFNFEVGKSRLNQASDIIPLLLRYTPLAGFSTRTILVGKHGSHYGHRWTFQVIPSNIVICQLWWLLLLDLRLATFDLVLCRVNWTRYRHFYKPNYIIIFWQECFC